MLKKPHTLCLNTFLLLTLLIYYTQLTVFQTQDWKRSVFIPVPKKGNAKECSTYHITVPISHASKVVLKILQARLQQYMNQEPADTQARSRKGRGTRYQIANIHWIIEKVREF